MRWITLHLRGICGGDAVHAQQIEKRDVHIAVGGKSALYYLPLVLTERLGYFKDEGLTNFRISDFAGGTRSLEAVVGGSADVVAGAYEHTINMQSRRQNFQAFVLAGASPQISVAISSKLADKYKSPKDLKGLKVGVSAPGSSTNMVINYVLAQGGLKPTDVAIIGVGAGATVIAAIEQGRVDVVSQTDPAVTMLERDGKVKVIAETRTPEGTQKLFGGPMPAGSLYAPIEFVAEEPEHRAGADQRDGAHPELDAGRDAAADPRHRAGGVPARQQGDVPVRLQQREDRVLEGRLLQRRRREDHAEGAGLVQPEHQAGRNQPRPDVHQRVREEGAREVRQEEVMSARCPALALEGIRVTFVSQDGGRYTAIRDTTLRVAPGEFVSVVGPTGCGKSTLLNVAAGLLQPSAGATSVFGETLSGLNRKAGYLFQSEALMPWRTALQNVTAGLEFRGSDAAQAARAGGGMAAARRAGRLRRRAIRISCPAACASAWRWRRR